MPAEKVRVTVDRAKGAVRYETVLDGEMTVVASGPAAGESARLDVRVLSPRRGTHHGVAPRERDRSWRCSGAVTHLARPRRPRRFRVPASRRSPSGTRALASETTFAGFDWTDGEFVYRPDGGLVPSGGSRGTVAFVDQEQNLFGQFDGDGTGGTKRLSDTPEGARPVMMLGRHDDGSDVMAATVLVVLPAGATAIEVTPRAGATLGSTEVVDGTTTETRRPGPAHDAPVRGRDRGAPRPMDGCHGKAQTSDVGF